MALFDKVWQQMNTRLDQAKLNKEIEKFRHAVYVNPNDTEALRQLGTLYQNGNMAEEAIETFMRLADIYQRGKQYDLAIAYLRKIERLGDNDRRASILKEIERIQHALAEFEEAYRTCRQIIEVYLNINQKEAARGFINALPPFGDKDELYRKELREMIGVRDENWAQGAKGTWVDNGEAPQASTPAPTSAPKPGVPPAVAKPLSAPVNASIPAVSNPATPPSPVASWSAPKTGANPAAPAPLPGYPVSRTVHVSEDEKAALSEMTVMVVDDDPNICLLLSTAIKNIGCQVITANNGVEGIDKALRLRPNLIISDLLMPKMDGNQFFRKLQEYPETRVIPFVCLTSRGQEEEKLAAFEIGVEDYWVKPFSIAEITMRIKKLVQRQLQTLQNEYASSGGGQVELAGSLTEMTPSDLLRFCATKHKSGVLRFKSGDAEGAITLLNGEVIDAQYANLMGEPALFTLLNWQLGNFTFQSQPITSPRTIIATTDELISRMMERYDEEYYLIEQLPHKDSMLMLSQAFYDALNVTNFPRSVERLMILIDGNNALGECLEQLRGDTDALRLLVELYRQGWAVVVNS